MAITIIFKDGTTATFLNAFHIEHHDDMVAIHYEGESGDGVIEYKNIDIAAYCDGVVETLDYLRK